MSKTSIGAIVMLIQALLNVLNIQVADEHIQGAVEAVFVLGGFVLILVGQLQRKDLKFGLLRKK